MNSIMMSLAKIFQVIPIQSDFRIVYITSIDVALMMDYISGLYYSLCEASLTQSTNRSYITFSTLLPLFAFVESS